MNQDCASLKSVSIAFGSDLWLPHLMRLGRRRDKYRNAALHRLYLAMDDATFGKCSVIRCPFLTLPSVPQQPLSVVAAASYAARRGCRDEAP